MKELFDALGELAQKAKLSLSGGSGTFSGGATAGLGSLFGDLIGSAQKGGTLAQKAAQLKNASGGLIGPAALGGVLGTLLVSRTARDVALSAGKGALALGGGAAVAAAAWDMYRKWSGRATSSGQASGASAPNPMGAAPAADDPERDRQTGLLLRAMVFAARSDGHMDEEEKANIRSALADMGLDPKAAASLGALMDEPADPQALAASVRTPEEARDVYRLSCLAVRVDQFMERNYLDALAAALGIAEPEKTALEREAEAMRAEGQSS